MVYLCDKWPLGPGHKETTDVGTAADHAAEAVPGPPVHRRSAGGTDSGRHRPGLASADTGDPPGTIRTVAGVTTNYKQGGFSGDGGKASDSQLYHPRAVAFTRSGEVTSATP